MLSPISESEEPTVEAGGAEHAAPVKAWDLILWGWVGQLNKNYTDTSPMQVNKLYSRWR